MGGKALDGRIIDRHEAKHIGDHVIGLLSDFLQRAQICGSWRRGKQVGIGDVDIVVMPAEGKSEALSTRLRELFGDYKNGNPKRSGLVEGVQVEILIASPEAWGAALCMATGSGKWNVVQRHHAKELGYKLNQYGLFYRDTNEYICGATEEEIYEVLGMTWREPGERK
jgi:DNA polymerase (family 10)